MSTKFKAFLITVAILSIIVLAFATIVYSPVTALKILIGLLILKVSFLIYRVVLIRLEIKNKFKNKSRW